VEAYAGNATPFFLRFSASQAPRTSAPVNHPPHHITQCSFPSITQIPIAPIKLIKDARFHRSRGLDIPTSPHFNRPPIPISRPTPKLGRTSLTDTQALRIAPPFFHGHHGSPCLVVVFPTLQNAEPSPSKESWVVIGGPGAPAPSQQVLCAHPNHLHLHHHAGSSWILSHLKNRAPNFHPLR